MPHKSIGISSSRASIENLTAVETGALHYYQSLNLNRTLAWPQNLMRDIRLSSPTASTSILSSTFLYGVVTFVPNTQSAGGILLNVPFIQRGYGNLRVTLAQTTATNGGNLWIGMRFAHFPNQSYGFTRTAWITRKFSGIGDTVIVHLSDFDNNSLLTPTGLSDRNRGFITSVITFRMDLLFAFFTPESHTYRVQLLEWDESRSYPEDSIVIYAGSVYVANSNANAGVAPNVSQPANPWTLEVPFTSSSRFPYPNVGLGFSLGDSILFGGTREACQLNTQFVNDGASAPEIEFFQPWQPSTRSAIVS